MKIKMFRVFCVASVLGVFGAPVLADNLPLGDGKIASQPTVGYVYRCGQGHDGHPRLTAGPWIQGTIWNPDLKPTVQGNVSWPNAKIAIELFGNERVISTNTLPDHTTGVYPIQSNDPAYRYDRNPNRISSHGVLLRIPAQPTEASTPSCLTPGPIGYMLTGVAIFDALDANGDDAPAHEVQDHCSGHPQQQGQYHYHNASSCLHDDAGKRDQHSDLVGYATDGFGIYGLKGEGGRELTNDDLDECHGHTHTVTWDGKPTRLYHYHLTRMFPYSLGCFKGKPVRTAGDNDRGPRDMEGPRGIDRSQGPGQDFRPPPPFGGSHPPRPRPPGR